MRPPSTAYARYWLKFFSQVAICLILLLTSASAHAGPVLRVDADKQFDFAEHYFSNADYMRAVGEYKRFIYFFPDDNRIERAMFQCAKAYFLSGQFLEAIASFKEVITRFSESELAVESYFMISESQIGQNQFGAAAVTLHNLITLSDSADTRDEAFYRLAWIYIETASWQKAKDYLDKISAPNREKYRLKMLSTELEKERLIKKKNPSLSGMLSIVPGGGYLYCERYQDALIALLLNGTLIWAAVEAFDSNNNALGALLTFVEVGFYAGNIYGAISSAHKYNRNTQKNFIDNLKKNTKINLSGNLESKTIQLSFRFTF